jgi:nucleoside-diphosphate-sugar epimerase
MSKRILVLGAGGFIGRRVVEELARDGSMTPVAAVRSVPAQGFPAGVEVIVLDATLAADLSRAAETAAGVVNCVAGSTHSIVAGAGALAGIERARDASLRIVHLSSLAVYGTGTGTVDESAALKGDLDEYSAAKVTAEKTLQPCASLVILRPGIVYGPGSPLWSGYIGRLLVSGRLGSLGAAGDGICNLILVQDLVTAIKQSLALPEVAGGVFNAAAAGAPTWNEYFRRYAAALGAPPLRPMSTLRLAAETRVISPALKIAGMLMGSPAWIPPAIRPWLLARCRQHIRMDVTRAEKSLAMKWQPLDIGLSTTAKWFRDAVRS